MESDLNSRFHATAQQIRDWHPVDQPSNDDKLKIYGLFKQGTDGDCNTTRPGMFDWAGSSKWDAWNSRKGMSREQAQSAYIDEAKRQFEAFH